MRTAARKMSENKIERKIISHYRPADLSKKVRAELKSFVTENSTPTLRDFAALDQVHIGGLRETNRLAAKAEIKPDSLVLDPGCGLGGPARVLVAEFLCRVVGIDLTGDFCQVAQLLSHYGGFSGATDFLQGNALHLPVKTGIFDTIWLQHVALNIPDKKALFSECHRVLKPGGQLVIHEIFSGSRQPPHFPVPWATDGSINFLSAADETRQILQTLQFREIFWEDTTEESLSWYRKRVD
ncbi:MAG TPA: class I SAM-dependent methyltransferase, partial [Caldithrix sp.]|nr:class I SAM-dependent methyltransferase [Caldithrix sp.]